MTFDLSINLGHLLTMISSVGAAVFYFGRYKVEAEMTRADVREIKEDLRSMIRDNTLLSNTVTGLAQRVAAHEEEIARVRSRLHDVADFAHTLQADFLRGKQ